MGGVPTRRADDLSAGSATKLKLPVYAFVDGDLTAISIFTAP